MIIKILIIDITRNLCYSKKLQIYKNYIFFNNLNKKDLFNPFYFMKNVKKCLKK